MINRTPGAVAYKLVNFASLDPSLKKRGIKGADHGSKLDRVIWDEFYNDWEELSFQSEKLLAEYENRTLDDKIDVTDEIPEGKVKESLVKTRVNQSFFRSSILASYGNTCCITGISQTELLIAGHIKPWSIDKKNRMNPRNGIAINALHDKAFEAGLITITTEYKIKISPLLLKQKETPVLKQYFFDYENKEIHPPTRFLPDPEFLRYHNEKRFRG